MTFSFNVGGLTPQDAQNQGQGGGTTIVEMFSPKNIAGLICCFDGEINSRAGVRDTAVNGMQNLVYNPMTGNNSTGGKEALNGTPSFTAKGCKLGGTSFIPNYNLKSLTIEFVVELDAVDFNNPINQQIILNGVYNGGIQMMFVSSEQRLYYQVVKSDNTTVKNVYYGFPFEAGKKYHIAVTDAVDKAGTTKLYVNGVETQPTTVTDKEGGTTSPKNVNIGFGGICSTATSSVVPTTSQPTPNGGFYAEHTTFYKFRMWNRQLSATELKNNYDADVKALA